MQRDEIIEMARQAGLMAFKYPDLISKSDWENLEAFAKLVAAKENIECSKIPRQHALELADGIFGKRFPNEALAVLRATDAMAEKIKARVSNDFSTA